MAFAVSPDGFGLLSGHRRRSYSITRRAAPEAAGPAVCARRACERRTRASGRRALSSASRARGALALALAGSEAQLGESHPQAGDALQPLQVRCRAASSSSREDV